MTNSKSTHDHGVIHGHDLLHNSAANKSTAFTLEEREKFGLRGLLPYSVSDQGTHQKRALGNLRRKAYDIEKYIFLSGLQDRNEKLFYRMVIDNIEEIMPLIYTPTVGQACKEFAHIFRRAQGFYICLLYTSPSPRDLSTSRMPSSA